MSGFDVVKSKTSLDVFWVAHPDSINAEGANWDSLANDFLALVGNSGKQWRLIIAIGAPTVRASGGLLNPEQLHGFLKRLQQRGVVPTELGYHPDFQGSHDYPTWKGWGFPDASAFSVKGLAEKSVADFDAYNRVLSADPSVPSFTSFHIEGHAVAKDSKDFGYWSSLLNGNKQANDKAYIDVFATGDWAQGVFTHSDGVIQQLYNFAAPNPYTNLPTNPAKASSFGSGVFSSLQAGGADSSMNAAVFDAPSIYPQVFSWNWDGPSAAPVFNPTGTLKGETWTNDQFEDFLGSYTDAFIAYKDNHQGNAPVLGVWAAEYAVPQLADNLKNARPLEAFSAVARQGEIDVLVERYQQDIVLINDKERTLDASVLVNCEFLNGIGFYPLLDSTGRVVSIEGKVLSPGDNGYLAAAKKLSQQASLWHEGGGGVSTSIQYQPVLQANTRYAIIADSQVNKAGGLSSSLRAANPSHKIHIAPDADRNGLRIGFEDSITGDQDFNDLGIHLGAQSPVRFQSTSVFTDSMVGDPTIPAPHIDVLWQNITALDDITAFQVASLIAGNPNNSDLELVINISGPANTALHPIPPSHKNPNETIGYTPDQFVKFLNTIDSHLAALGAEWTGELTFKPDISISEIHNWKGCEVETVDGVQFALGKGPAPYIDYMGLLNGYLEKNQTKARTFSKLLFEQANSNYNNAEAFANGGAWRSYKGASEVWGSRVKPVLDDFKFLVTDAPIVNWQSLNADGLYAQMYDLQSPLSGGGDPNADTYPFTAWNSKSMGDELAPLNVNKETGDKKYSPSDAASLFKDFSANLQARGKAGNSFPYHQTYNVRGLIDPLPVNTPSSLPATKFAPDSSFIFSYGPFPSEPADSGAGESATQHHGPVFQSGKFKANQKPPNDWLNWRWDHNHFSEFISEFRQQVPAGLGSVAEAKNVPSSFVSDPSSLSVGVWNSENALDAWFGVPSPSQFELL